jgi:cystathionine beta-synthase
MTERHLEPYDSILDLIGWTPLVRLKAVTDGARTPVYVKCEFMNPGGSVKDRIGLAMIEQAEKNGTLKPGGTVVEATGGNTGLALAMAASLKGYRCICTMPDKMSSEKVKLLRAFGAEVIITPTAVASDHPDHYLQRARSITAETPGAVMADQFYNPANPDAHYQTTGREIWEQTGGRVTHFVASAGTGGTITGVGRYLKEKNPDVRIIGIDPQGSMIAPYFNTGRRSRATPTRWRGSGTTRFPARSIWTWSTSSGPWATARRSGWRAASPEKRGCSPVDRRDCWCRARSTSRASSTTPTRTWFRWCATGASGT